MTDPYKKKPFGMGYVRPTSYKAQVFVQEDDMALTPSSGPWAQAVQDAPLPQKQESKEMSQPPFAPQPPCAPPPPTMPRGSEVRVILKAALEHIDDRAEERDVGTERSMSHCVKAFNAMFDKDLTEEEGWRFMELLKMSRSRTSKNPDHYEDGAAYAGFAGEAAYYAKHRGKPKV
ncbi:hypothetical protein [Vibrio phage JSF7]|uniref:DUF6378 domain-containing protein n=1 Tax=Vibrio phage JSF7 TaxID=1292086 RepID=A0A240EWX4_9CAUD|nr:hypothetical protein HOQ92_gp44 [Vibrio phage JSF7]APD18168.1 hypothetical protein [Vibrio phage JSF7]